MRTRSSASAAVCPFGSSGVRTQIPPSFADPALASSLCMEGLTRASERDGRSQGNAPRIANTSTAIPASAMTNSVLGGNIRERSWRRCCDSNREERKRPQWYRQSTMEHERHLQTSSSLSMILERSRPHSYGECEARCSASHCSLIQPKGAAFAPPGTRILGMMTTATDTMTRPTMNSMEFRRNQVLSRRIAIVAFLQSPVCALVHRPRVRECCRVRRQPAAISVCGGHGRNAAAYVCIRGQRRSAPARTLLGCNSYRSRPSWPPSGFRRC